MKFNFRQFDSNPWYLRFRRSAGQAYHAWLATDPAAVNEFATLLKDSTNYEIMAYFGDDLSRAYQITQWLPVYEELNKKHKVQIIARQHPTTEFLRTKTSLPVNTVYDFFTLTDLVDAKNFKVILYVNNSFTNFQAMAAKRAFHVHLNHGESDKMSMTSRQMYAYDVIAVAGQAAKDRLNNSLLVRDDEKQTVIGRPQLDLLEKPTSVPLNRKVLVYAPTWEGDQEANNYSSIDIYGEKIIDSLLKISDATVLYKPHPKVVTSPNSAISNTHNKIIEKIKEANSKDLNAQHRLVLGDPMPVLQAADLMISDVSAVTIDYLYLKPNGALLMCDRRSDTSLFNEIAPVSKAVTIIDTSNINQIDQIITDHLNGKSDKSKYEQMRSYYFGDTKPGNSITRFNEMVDDLVKRRDNRVSQMPKNN